MSTPILPLAVWASGTNQNSIPANDNSLRIEALSRKIISQSVAAQPASPADGDTYIIASTPTGAQWATFTPKDIAMYRSGAWYAWAPTEGLIVNVNGAEFNYIGGVWTAIGGGGGGMTNPMTTTGDIIYSSSGSTPARLGVGTNGWVLTLAAGVPTWAVSASGFANPMTTVGDLIVGGTSGAAGRVAASTSGFVLTANGAGVAPTWQASAGGAFTGGTLASALNEAPTVTIASSATPAIGAAAGNSISLTGTTTVTGFDVIAAGAFRRVVFAGALTLTHNATSLILPSAANITTVAGDVAEFLSLGAGNWRCTSYAKASGAALVGGGGGALTNWADALNTAAPNATAPVASLSVTNAATNVDGAIIPKGAGANLASIPDNSAAGGNKRGGYATDWQKFRNANTQVASGSQSSIGGGARNTASAANATVAGGFTNEASGTDSTIGGGNGNTASGNGSMVIGGQGNNAIGNYSAAGGYTSTASGNYSIAFGYASVANADFSMAIGRSANARSIQGAFVHSAGIISAAGDSQAGRYILSGQTLNATPAAIGVAGQSVGANTTVVLPNSSAYFFTMKVVALVTGGTTIAGWKIEGTIKRNSGGASTTALVGTPVVTAMGAIGGALAVAAVADTTNGSLNLQVTGIAATTINWVCLVETVECIA